MKKLIAVILAASLVISLTGCMAMRRYMDETMGNVFGDEYYYDDEPYFEILDEDMRESISEGYFKVKIFTDKDTYKDGEVIECWVTVEYIGESDSIDVYAYYGNDSPVYFSVYGGEYYDDLYPQYEKEQMMTFIKGEPVRFDYEKNMVAVQYREPHTRYLDKYYSDEKFVLPPGEYEIGAALDVYLETSGAVTCYQYVWANITVTE